ncbi:hypothetical protein [Mycolicibacterium vaccae]|uniref:hypothetical protein n=1 Tax=Mycolicibacterium vaccae TaxID=1810 RepID=UPI003D06E169
MAFSPRHRVAKIAAAGALTAGAALVAAATAGAQPAPPVDPAVPPPAPGAAPEAPPVFAYTPLAPGEVPPPAPPPAGAPFVPPVPNANFGNTGQMDFLRELWNMRNSAEFFQAMGPGTMDPGTWVPPAPYGSPPPPPGAPPAPASAPPPVWPPAGMVPGPVS